MEFPEYLYHYTSVDGMNGLAKGKQLWATNFGHLNDPVEVVYAFELAEKLLRHLLNPAEVPYSGKAKEVDTMCLCGVRSLIAVLRGRQDGSSKQMRTQAQKLVSTLPFVVSLSKHSDSLGMWRAYGENGKGFALGLRSNELRDELEVEGRVKIRPVVYDLGQQIMLILSLPRDSKDDFLERLCALASSLKHPAYIREGEWRIEVSDHKDWLPETRVSGGRIVPFRKSPQLVRAFEKMRVVIGPRQEMQEQHLRDLVYPDTERGPEFLDAQFIHSEVPYRE